MEFKVNEVKDWIVVAVYSDDDDPPAVWRVIANNEEIKAVLESFANPLVEEFSYKIGFENREYGEDFLYYVADFTRGTCLEVMATALNTMLITTVKNFVTGENK